MQIYDSCETSQASTNTSTFVTASTLDAYQAMSVSYTVKNAGANSVNFEVIAGNLADLSDAVQVQAPATVANGAVGSYAVSIAPYVFYGIKIVDTVGGNHGTVTVRGRAKG